MNKPCNALRKRLEKPAKKGLITCPVSLSDRTVRGRKPVGILPLLLASRMACAEALFSHPIVTNHLHVCRYGNRLPLAAIRLATSLANSYIMMGLYAASINRAARK
jgi:hypothetical protein